MKLQRSYASESAIPADQKALYVQHDGKWVLDVDGLVPQEKLDEFRTNNIELLRLTGETDIEKAKAKLAKLKDVDPDKYAEMLTTANEAAAEKLKKEGKLGEVHKQELAAKDAAHQKVVDELTAKNKKSEDKIKTLLIDDAIVRACGTKGVRPEAIEDVRLLGRTVFELDGEEVIGKNGTTVLFDAAGKKLTVEGWLDQRISNDKKHWALPNQGGGAGGGNKAANGAINPWSKKTFNRTLQAKMNRENPELAKTLEGTAEQ